MDKTNRDAVLLGLKLHDEKRVGYRSIDRVERVCYYPTFAVPGRRKRYFYVYPRDIKYFFKEIFVPCIKNGVYLLPHITQKQDLVFRTPSAGRGFVNTLELTVSNYIIMAYLLYLEECRKKETDDQQRRMYSDEIKCAEEWVTKCIAQPSEYKQEEFFLRDGHNKTIWLDYRQAYSDFLKNHGITEKHR